MTIPSKIQSYLACGKPILASLDGEGAKIINEAECGFTSPSEDAKALAENVYKLYNLSNNERNKMGILQSLILRKILKEINYWKIL